MVIVLPVILFYVLRSKALQGNDENTTDAVNGMLIFKCILIAVVIGIYDGIYGPGTGTFLMLLFTGFCHMTLNDAAGTTKAINLTTNITALVVFLINGKVLLHWELLRAAVIWQETILEVTVLHQMVIRS